MFIGANKVQPREDAARTGALDDTADLAAEDRKTARAPVFSISRMTQMARVSLH